MKSLLDKVNAKLNAQGGFLKSIMLLVSGMVFAHAITVLALPFITRLYSPEDFSRLAVYTSLLGIFSVIACLRYEIAIPLPETDCEAERLLIISIFNSFIFSTFLFFILFVFSNQIKYLLGSGYFTEITWLLPLGVFATSLYSAYKFWCTRVKDFKAIAHTKIQQSISSIVAQLTLGWLGMTSIGMLIGQFLYNGAGVISLIRKKGLFLKHQIFQLKETYKNYIQYPKYSVGEALFNTAGVHLPILIIAAAESKEAGYLLLASKIMVIPMVLIGTSVSQVYYAHASEENKKNNLRNFTFSCMKKLLFLGFFPLLLIGILAPFSFSLFFGYEWERAGELVAWMTPWFIMQFIVSPVTMVFHISGLQKKALFLQFIGLFLKISLVYFTIFFNEIWVSEMYAVSGFLFYLIYIICIYRYIK
ncbi:lipopolysaccharide biosynthesis protein [Acinetobacter radioresistens]|uniref:lipopolysaccharide biosynthesis protein n=1 Tax=Acinetobacter radioresistens TaxID=40216 RepID=UPI002A59B912|nr:oligosaccharide flippase family protein [Acinetobacter radioresistens]MDY0841959.1 oligosaccharide flippase family protein [Acinetobacter radioresistens]